MNVKRPQAKRRTSAGCLTFLIIIAAILLLGRPIRILLDWPFNPWAYSWRGEPTLVGTWVGAITSPSGQRSGLFLDLRRSRDSRGNFSSCAQCPDIEGAARLCGGSGEQRYEIWGGPDTWSGSRFHLKKLAVEPKIAGLQLGYMEGEWTGNVLRISMTFEAKDDDAAAQASDNLDVSVPVQFTLERGDEPAFLATCGKLSATGL